jgi:hypothetical protein
VTVVVAYREMGGDVWLGADTAVSSEGFIYPVRLAKWDRYGRWALAMTGSQTVQDLARRHAGAIADCEDAESVAVLLHRAMRDDGWEPVENKGGIPCFNTNGILVSAAGLWLVSGSGVVDVPSWGFAAAGSGEDFAYGAAYALLRGNPMQGLSGEVIVRSAVVAAIAFRTDCGGDVVVERL